jgi:hypothetical protein
MPSTPALPAILADEDALQSAWLRKDRIAAADLKARLTGLWAQRRTELAALSKRTPSGWDAMPFSVRRQA